MIALVFLGGLVVGSFLNAVIYRLHSGQSILERHSRCPHCRHELYARDLIPVVSFLILKGHCRYCKKTISWQYPLVELVTAVGFVLVYSQFRVLTSPYPPQAWGGVRGEVDLLFQFIFVSFLILIFVYDLKHYFILDKVVFPAAVLAAAYQIFQNNFLNGLLGAALLSGFFGLLFWVSRGRWIGFGDIKLGIFLGFLVPWPATLALVFLAYLLGALVSLLLLALGSKTLKDRLPFGTFLTLAAFVAMLKGEELIDWYFKLIGIR